MQINVCHVVLESSSLCSCHLAAAWASEGGAPVPRGGGGSPPTILNPVAAAIQQQNALVPHFDLHCVTSSGTPWPTSFEACSSSLRPCGTYVID